MKRLLFALITCFVCLLPTKQVLAEPVFPERYAPVEAVSAPQVEDLSLDVPKPVSELALMPEPPPPAPAAPASRAVTGGYGGAGYSYGYCTWYVATQVRIPLGLGDAINWDDRAPGLGGVVSATPQPGAVAQSNMAPLGHVAVVIAVRPGQALLREMNWVGWNKISERWVPAATYNYLYF